MIRNPIDVRCPNKQCGAQPGHACRTVGGFVNASPHTPRWKQCVGALSTQEERTATVRAYSAAVLEKIIRRAPTEEEIGRAQREGSLKPDKGWLRDLVEATAAPLRALPTKRTDAHGTVTFWGAVKHERSLEGGSIILQLDSGEVITLLHNEAWPWREWWPERKAEAERFLPGKPIRYRFTMTKLGQVIGVHFEAAPELAQRTPARGARVIDDAQGSLL